jgi:hypothetical protein
MSVGVLAHIKPHFRIKVDSIEPGVYQDIDPLTSLLDLSHLGALQNGPDILITSELALKTHCL